MKNKLNQIFLAIVFIFLFPVIINGQVTQEWVARYNGPGNNMDEGMVVRVDRYGNVYVTGQANWVSGQSYDIITLKYNSSGEQLWLARYNGPGNYLDKGNSMELDALGNVYVTGMSSQSAVKSDFVTIKYNSSGIQQWITTYHGTGGNSQDEAFSIALDSYNNVYVTGRSSNVHDYDCITIKYNSAGAQQWISTYAGPGNGFDVPKMIVADASNNVYVTGASVGSGTDIDFFTIKYNSSGVQQWVQRYNGTGNYWDEANSIALDSSGNVYATGYTMTTNSFYSADYATIKYNSNGIQQWIQTYNGPANYPDKANSIAVDVSGNVYITGGSPGGSQINDYATIKYNPSGVQQWVQRYNGAGTIQGNDEAYSITVDVFGNVYVTGCSSAGTFEDYATIKYSTSGIQQWVARYNGTSGSLPYDKACSIVLDSSGNVYVTGTSEGYGTFRDYVTIKYSQLVGISSTSNKIPSEFNLHQNYPNPFNPVTKIKFDVPASNLTLNGVKGLFVQLVVYDVLGREVANLIPPLWGGKEGLSPGTYEVEWDGSNFPSGVYFYKLTISDASSPQANPLIILFSETKKMVLIK